jgi:hypothetical protein
MTPEFRISEHPPEPSFPRTRESSALRLSARKSLGSRVRGNDGRSFGADCKCKGAGTSGAASTPRGLQRSPVSARAITRRWISLVPS